MGMASFTLDSKSVTTETNWKQMDAYRHAVTPVVEMGLWKWALTGAQTKICIDIIAVVARFAGLHETVTTGRPNTGTQALVGFVIVPVVTRLDPGMDNAIATAGDLARVQATIYVQIIGIVAGFDPCLSEAIAASG